MSAVIRCADLSKVYQMGEQEVRALNGASLEVQPNEYVAIMGQSGSGKSTLLNILGCLDVPTSGEYFLNGQAVSQLSESELARTRNRSIGFVFQSFNLLPRFSALENVARPLVYRGIGRKEREERAKEAMHRVGLGDRLDHRPNELSGGQRQRVAVARALCGEPAILLADEPTGNLDSETSAEIVRLFDELHEAGNTIVLITHEQDIADCCRRIIRLADGQVVEDRCLEAGHVG